MTFAVDGAPVPTGGPEDRLPTWARVKDITGISRTTARRMQKAGDFPEPVAISPKRVGWWECELTPWKATRKAGGKARSLAPPRKPTLIETARSPASPRPLLGRQQHQAIDRPRELSPIPPRGPSAFCRLARRRPQLSPAAPVASVRPR
ncbi:AlpA family phage regulatory protein [Brevundimonas sp. NIBR10]|uniref:helix-turn-helix transcriptional regulator n=1 Tax=Brevundimonas sp. NIBR10 TaxID=3015997 RepID=UPI0022F1B635|nr:AlpA family phage regulatory protein [Brevundimonas sp. NIBR10]